MQDRREKRVRPTRPNTQKVLFAFDVDGDGRQDLLAGNVWFKYTKGQFVPTRIGKIGGRIVAAQFTPTKNAEVIIAPGDGSGPLMYFSCDGDPTQSACWKGRDLVGRDLVHGHSLRVRDINGDGHQDIFAAEMAKWGQCPQSCFPDATAFVFYGNGRGGFRRTTLVKGHGWHEPGVGDFDGDGDLDILNKPYTWEAPRVDLWLQNGTGARDPRLPLNRWRRHLIDGALAARGMFILPGDINGDGLQDIAVAGVWYQNPGPGRTSDGHRLTWQKRSFGMPLHNVAALYDFDGDGDLDAFGTKGKGAESNAHLVWAQNDGKGHFKIHDNIPAAQGDFLQGVAPGRFAPKGGPIEIALSWHRPGMGCKC